MDIERIERKLAKSDINRLTEKLGMSEAKIRRERLELTFRQMDIELRKPNPIQLGPRQLAINKYEEVGKKDGIEAAYRVIHEKFNEPIGKVIYTKDIVTAWLDDYEQKKKVRKHDDDAR